MSRRQDAPLMYAMWTGWWSAWPRRRLALVVCLHVVCDVLTPVRTVNSCLWSPCRWTLEQSSREVSEIGVEDRSNHSIGWSWSVAGGTWLVYYAHSALKRMTYGEVRFVNSSSELDAVVTWGTLRNWTSNAVRIHAPAWNITYNGDTFGFRPTLHGMYTLHVFTKNKRHNPFASYYIEEPCFLLTTDKESLKSWWSGKKKSRRCNEMGFDWTWRTDNGAWEVLYTSTLDSSRVNCSVAYQRGRSDRALSLIYWEIDRTEDSVRYRTARQGGMSGEAAWLLDLAPQETWGFTLLDQQGNWIFNHNSLGLIFTPFPEPRNQVKTMSDIK